MGLQAPAIIYRDFFQLLHPLNKYVSKLPSPFHFHYQQCHCWLYNRHIKWCNHKSPKEIMSSRNIFINVSKVHAPIRRLPFQSASFSSPLIPSLKQSLSSSHRHHHHQYCFKCEFWWNLWEIRISRYPCRKLTYCSGNNKFIF